MSPAFASRHGDICWIAHNGRHQQHSIQHKQRHLVAVTFFDKVGLVDQWKRRMEPSKVDIQHPLQRSFTQPIVQIPLPQQRYLGIDDILTSLVRRIKALGNRKVKPLLIIAPVAQKRCQHIVNGIRQAERVARVKGADGIADGLLRWPHALVGDVQIEERAGVGGCATLK